MWVGTVVSEEILNLFVTYSWTIRTEELELFYKTTQLCNTYIVNVSITISSIEFCLTQWLKPL